MKNNFLTKTKTKLHIDKKISVIFYITEHQNVLLKLCIHLKQLKQKHFLHHWMSDHRREALLKCCSCLYLKYFHQCFEVCSKIIVFHPKN